MLPLMEQCCPLKRREVEINEIPSRDDHFFLIATPLRKKKNVPAQRYQGGPQALASSWLVFIRPKISRGVRRLPANRCPHVHLAASFDLSSHLNQYALLNPLRVRHPSRSSCQTLFPSRERPPASSPSGSRTTTSTTPNRSLSRAEMKISPRRVAWRTASVPRYESSTPPSKLNSSVIPLRRIPSQSVYRPARPNCTP